MWGIDCGKFNGLFLFLNWAYIASLREISIEGLHLLVLILKVVLNSRNFLPAEHARVFFLGHFFFSLGEQRQTQSNREERVTRRGSYCFHAPPLACDSI